MALNPKLDDSLFDFNDVDDDDQAERLENRWKRTIYREAIKFARRNHIPPLDLEAPTVQRAFSHHMLAGDTMETTYLAIIELFQARPY